MKIENVFFIIVGLGLIVFLGIFIFVTAKKPISISRTQPTSKLTLPPLEIENPVSKFCTENNGFVDIRSDREGNQRGFCIFPDGSECEEWSFFRGECKKGQKICRDLCGNGRCEEIVCMATGCPCPETRESCPQDCQI